MKVLFRIALAAMAMLFSASAFADGLKPTDFIPAQGQRFTFLGPSGVGKSTVITVLARHVVLGDGDDQMIADRVNRDIYTPGPDGDFISMREMTAQFTGGGAASGSTSGASDITDPDAEFEALFEGLPPTMKRQLRAQFQQLPRDQAIMALRVMRGQMGLPTIDPGQLPQRAAPKAAERTGNTEKLDGTVLHEYLVAGDRIWAVDPDQMEGGEKLIEGLVALGDIFKELSAGLPTEDSSFFRIGELDGRAPYRVMTADGEVFTYLGTTTAEVMVPNF